ncbi:MAG: SAM-dependent chlorinase/fluorinase [Kiloniellales bacterium]|nr:SAM-dependent chlorinase/fluorinase [Kiloniellales bacterium]
MFVLFTDFGLEGPYIGQVKAALWQGAPDRPVIDLLSDAPPFDPRSGAYLLAAYAAAMPPGCLILGVVDPGVGGPRQALAVKAGGRWFLGPDNGLLAIAARRAGDARVWQIDWRGPGVSASFHGRDVFAPLAARLARGEALPGREVPADTMVGADWPADLDRIVYIDRFGNAMTGLRAAALGPGAVLEAGGRRLARADSFFQVPVGATFWYENANGLAEIAVNQGRADRVLGLGIGTQIRTVAATTGED